MSTPSRLLAAGFVLAGLLGDARPAGAQCAMCKTAVTGSPEGRELGATLNTAILVLVASPYLVAGSVTAVFFRKRIAATLRRGLGRSGPGSPRPPGPGA